MTARGFTRRRRKSRQTGGLQRPLPLFPSLPAVRTMSPAKQPNRNNSLFKIFLSQFSDFCFSLGSSFSFRFLSFSVSGARQCDQGAAGDWVFVARGKRWVRAVLSAVLRWLREKQLRGRIVEKGKVGSVGRRRRQQKNRSGCLPFGSPVPAVAVWERAG